MAINYGILRGYDISLIKTSRPSGDAMLHNEHCHSPTTHDTQTSTETTL